MLRAAGMTAQTAGINFFWCRVLEHEDLRFVSTTRHMIGTGTVTALTPLLRSSTFLVQSGLPMWCFLPAGVNLCVASLAGFGTDVLGGIVGRRNCSRCSSRLCRFTRRYYLARSKSDWKKRIQADATIRDICRLNFGVILSDTRNLS